MMPDPWSVFLELSTKLEVVAVDYEREVEEEFSSSSFIEDVYAHHHFWTRNPKIGSSPSLPHR